MCESKKKFGFIWREKERERVAAKLEYKEERERIGIFLFLFFLCLGFEGDDGRTRGQSREYGR